MYCMCNVQSLLSVAAVLGGVGLFEVLSLRTPYSCFEDPSTNLTLVVPPQETANAHIEIRNQTGHLTVHEAQLPIHIIGLGYVELITNDQVTIRKPQAVLILDKSECPAETFLHL